MRKVPSNTESYLDFPLDRCDVVRTPQEWHQEHLDFMQGPGGAYVTREDAEKLEAIVYFDHTHGHFIASCTYCLELMWFSKIMGTTLMCSNCGKQSDGEQAIRASYLLLIGQKHANCQLSQEAFQRKADATNPEKLLIEYLAKQEAAKIRLNQAEYRALQLVQSLFGEKAYKRLCRLGELWINGIDGLYYRLFWSRHGNVAVYQHRTQKQAQKANQEWKPIAVYCGHFGESYPVTDQFIAQILMLRTNPQTYIDQANPMQPEHFSRCGPDVKYRSKIKTALQCGQ